MRNIARMSKRDSEGAYVVQDDAGDADDAADTRQAEPDQKRQRASKTPAGDYHQAARVVHRAFGDCVDFYQYMIEHWDTEDGIAENAETNKDFCQLLRRLEKEDDIDGIFDALDRQQGKDFKAFCARDGKGLRKGEHRAFWMCAKGRAKGRGGTTTD